MTEEARHLEPVRMFDDQGDARGVMKDFAPRAEKLAGVEADAEPLPRNQPNASGYDSEHRVWVDRPADTLPPLEELVHPLDADLPTEASPLPVVVVKNTELPKGEGIPAME